MTPLQDGVTEAKGKFPQWIPDTVPLHSQRIAKWPRVSMDHDSFPKFHTGPQSCLYTSLQKVFVKPELAGCHVTHRHKQDKV